VQLKAEYALTGSRVPKYLDELKQKYLGLASTYLRSDSLKDVLFKTSYRHVSMSATDDDSENDDEEEGESNCPSCDKIMTVKKKAKGMAMHYGPIASGNRVIKDTMLRNTLKKALKE